MKMNLRAKEIINHVCSADSYVTIAHIAKNLSVSTKTIERELPIVEAALQQYGLALDKKTGVGIGVRGPLREIQNIVKELSKSHNETSYTPQQRQSVIVSRLLQQQDPVKLFEFASLLKVTEGTISNDLDKLADWFLEHELQLIRKPGLGIYLEGEETAIRKAIVHYIYENINEEQLLDLVYDNLAPDETNPESKDHGSGKYLLDLVDKTIIRKLEKSVHDVEAKTHYQLSDTAFVGLVVHLALTVQRLKKNENIEINKDFLNDLKQKKEYAIAELIGSSIESLFELVVPQDEIGYITMHLLGARNHYNSKNASSNVMDNFHLVKIAKSIMKIAQQATGKAIADNERLLVGLVNHLGPAISRLKMKLDIRNPLLKDMQKYYPELMDVSRQCAAELEAELGMRLPDSEIAYIAMHIGAAVEDTKQLKKNEHRILVACPTGMGTSRMLASRIKREYKNLQIIELVSAVHLSRAYVEKTQAEFIISTIPIPDCALPVVVVNSLLLQEDRDKINRQLTLLPEVKLQAPIKTAKPIKLPFKESLARLSRYNTAILDLLDSFFFAEDPGSTNLEELCGSVGRLVAADTAKQELIKRALLVRETYGGTVIKGNQMVLLHCRCAAVDHLRFGIIHLERYSFLDEVDSKNEKIKTAIIMLAPAKVDPYDLETISYISTILLERWGLIEILHEGNKKRIYQELEDIFRDFYKEKYNMLMEG